MNNKTEFEEIFFSYLKESKTDYAYMLTACWGSGKTYYVKNELSEKIKNLFQKSFEVIYYSLNGITSVDNLRKFINLSILTKKSINTEKEKSLRKLVSVTAKIFTSVKNPLLNISSNLIVSFSDEIVYSLVIPNLNNTIILLDDLERISESIDITDLLGQIYENYIVKGAKVLFICDESNINNERQNYDKEKEKYIRRTILFQPNKEKVFRNLLQDTSFYNDSSEVEKDYYLNALIFYYKNAPQPNFRNIKFILDIFNDIYKNYNNVKEEITCTTLDIHQLFYQVVVLGNLYKSGRTEEKNLTDNQYYEYLAKGNKNISEDPYYQARIQIVQYPNATKDLLLSIVGIIFHGQMNIEQFKEDIILEQDNLLKKLSHYKQFELAELIDLLKNIVSKLKEKEYTIYDYNLLTKSFLPLARKYLTDISENDIKKLVFESLKDFPCDYIDYYIKQDMSQSSPDFDFSDIPELQELFTKEVLDNRNELIQKIIISLGNNEDFVYRELSKSQNLFGEILKDKNYCSKVLEQSNTAICTFIGIINQEILRVSNANEFYNNYIPYLNDLSCFVKEQMQQTNDELRKEVLGDLDVYITKTIAHLEK